MKIFVTGGAGFIGSHLCRRLVGEGHAVTALDNLSTGSADNVADLLGKPLFDFYSGDVTSPESLSGFGEVFHLACPASPKAYQRDPVGTMMTNVRGSQNVLEWAREMGAKVLLASTSEVYGDPLESPQREDYLGNVNCTGPRACYDEGKRAAECLFFDYHRMYGTRIKVARIFNTYGPGMAEDDGRVVSNFITQALRGEPLTIYGDGSQTRSFCYVDDMVDGLIRLMESPDEVTGPVNLGNTDEVTIEDLAYRINSGQPPLWHSLPQDDPKRRCPDISMARQLLGWEPKTGLDDGLRRTIAYFRSRMEAAA